MKKKYWCLVIIPAIIVFSCSNLSQESDTKHLISWESEFITEDGEAVDKYYSDRSAFILPYVEKQCFGDTLKVSTLHEINSCGETIGVAEISNDTIYLETKLVGEEMCASVEFHKFTYVIVKEEVSNYIIVY